MSSKWSLYRNIISCSENTLFVLTTDSLECPAECGEEAALGVQVPLYHRGELLGGPGEAGLPHLRRVGLVGEGRPTIPRGACSATRNIFLYFLFNYFSFNLHEVGGELHGVLGMDVALSVVEDHQPGSHQKTVHSSGSVRTRIKVHEDNIPVSVLSHTVLA